MIIKKAYPRVSIAGNPADGFWGKCLSMTFKNFHAICKLKESKFFKITLNKKSIFFPDLNNILLSDNNLKNKELILPTAAIKTFFNYCILNKIKILKKAFSLNLEITIPFSLGLSGSSALSISILRALNLFYETNLNQDEIELIALYSETNEQQAYAGPQDPLVVNREKIVFMDFSKENYPKSSSLEKAKVHRDFSSTKEYLNPQTKQKVEYLPKPNATFFLILAETDTTLQPSPSFQQFRDGNQKIKNAIKELDKTAEQAKQAIINNNTTKLGEAINKSFEICFNNFHHDYLGKNNIQLVKRAQKCGAYAKFPGSGGAVFGIYPNKEVLNNLKKEFSANKIIKLTIQ